MSEKIIELVKEARGNSKERKFSQSFDIIVNLKLMDTKKPENRLNEIVTLPKGRGRDAKIVIFSDTLKGDDYTTVGSDGISSLASDKRKMKRLTADVDFFMADPKLMVAIGKSLGKVLAPRGKMPTLITGEPGPMINRFKKSVRVKVKDSPVVQCLVGIEGMSDEDVASNVKFILNFLEKKLPKGRNNIGKAMLKLTMGKPVKVEI